MKMIQLVVTVSHSLTPKKEGEGTKNIKMEKRAPTFKRSLFIPEKCHMPKIAMSYMFAVLHA